jgi:hypothetical protein
MADAAGTDEDMAGAGILSDPGALLLGRSASLLWEALAWARAKRAHPWRTPVLATVSADGFPEARAIVLRGVDPAARRLLFHTDLRSAKCRAIARQPVVALCFVDARSGLQLRVTGPGRLESDADLVAAAWASVPEGSRGLYGGALAPGMPLDGTAGAAASDGAGAFAVLEVEARALDWLWAEGARQARGMACWDGAGWVERRVAP